MTWGNNRYDTGSRNESCSESSSDDEHQEANSSNSICENETDNIGKDRVSKLKGMYEDTTSNIKEHNNNNLVQSNFRKTVSMSNLGSGHSQVWSSRFSQELKMGTTWCMPKTE